MAAAAPEPEADAASRVWVDGSGLAGPEVAEALVGRRVDILGTGQGTVTGYIRNKMSSNIFVVMVESKDSVHPVETKIALQRHKHNINAEDDKHGTTAAYVCCQQGNHECLAVLAVATGVDLGAFL